MSSPNERDTKEILLKTAALYISITIAYGHMQSLQFRSEHRSGILRVFVFWLWPLLPITDLLINLTKTIRYWRRTSSKGRFELLLGMPTTSGSISLYNSSTTRAPEHQNSISEKKYTVFTSIGRILVILICLTQSIGTTFIYFRRRHLQKDFHYWEFKNGILSISGIIICLQSLSIILIPNPSQPHAIHAKRFALAKRLIFVFILQHFYLLIFNWNSKPARYTILLQPETIWDTLIKDLLTYPDWKSSLIKYLGYFQAIFSLGGRIFAMADQPFLRGLDEFSQTISTFHDQIFGRNQERRHLSIHIFQIILTEFLLGVGVATFLFLYFTLCTLFFGFIILPMLLFIFGGWVSMISPLGTDLLVGVFTTRGFGKGYWEGILNCTVEGNTWRWKDSVADKLYVF